MNYQIGGNHFSVSSKFLLILESSLEKNYDQVWASKYTIITSYAKMKVACSKRFGPPTDITAPYTYNHSRLEFSEIYRKHFSRKVSKLINQTKHLRFVLNWPKIQQTNDFFSPEYLNIFSLYWYLISWSSQLLKYYSSRVKTMKCWLRVKLYRHGYVISNPKC